MNPTLEFPYRGQPFYRNGEYAYFMQVYGDFDDFSGFEKIFHKESEVYKLSFVGGQIIDIISD